MRILVLSDIHLEFGKFIPKDLGQDLTIIAGDLGEGPRGRGVIDEYKKIGKVLYVMGNHEYYNHEVKEVLEYWKAQDVLFEMRKETYSGISIAACTLWSDFQKDNPIVKLQAQGCMNDYIICKYNGRRLTPNDTFVWHKESVEWLKHNPADIVVTHHAPSFKSVSDDYKHDRLNGAYASNLEYLIEELKPKLWIHGHVHISKDYRIGETRVICNPRGYVGREPNPNFNPNFLIEINKNEKEITLVSNKP